MRLLYDLRWFAQEGVRSLWRGRGMALLSLGTMAAALFVLGVFFFLSHNVDRLVRSWEDEPDVSIFLRGDPGAEGLREIARVLGESPVVETYRHVSREEAVRLFHEAFPGLAGLEGEEGLPPSFEARLADAAPPGEVDALLQGLAGRPDVEEVRYDRAVRQALDRSVRWLRVGTFSLGFLFLLAASAIIFNGIRLQYMARGREVEILEVIGATRAFIFGPYLLEGAALGFLGGLFAVAALVGLEVYVLSHLPEPDPLLFPLSPALLPPLRCAGLVALGGLMGFLGSLLSLLRPLQRV